MTGTRPSVHEVAIHEAGHVVVARIVGACVKCIEFAPDDDENALAAYHAHSYVTLAQTDWAAVAYAGFVAQRRVNPECRPLRSADSDNFDACLKGASPATREKVMAWTEATVAAHWDEIEQLAAEIERCNGLYTRELEALGYWRPAPARNSNSALSRSLRGR